MSVLRPLVLSMLLAGCSSPTEPPICGESFCLPHGAKLLSKERPVEDFNLYRVEAQGERFSIYEGNHPQRREGNVVVTVGKEWPAFLEVSGPCRGNNDCAVRSFAKALVLR